MLTRVSVAISLVCAAALLLGQSRSGTSQWHPKDTEWAWYTADMAGTKYRPLDQINASNFNKLEIVWRFKTDNLGSRPEYKLEGTPLMVNGVLYTTGGTRRSVIALDAKTGEVNWVYNLHEGNRAVVAARQLSGRGVAYWSDGRGDDRILYVTTGYRLVALNAKNGHPITSFGENGIVDLKKGMVTGTGQQIDLETGEAGLHSTPFIVNDVAIVGSSFKEGMTVETHNNTKGLVRAFDVRTGKLLWTFNTIPRPGEFGNETWENGSWATNGNTGVWTQITADPELGLVYLPVESPTSDYYGGTRPGDNLFGESLVCVDLKTGKRKWHYQFVHHPIWDFDISSAPILMDINVNGKLIKAVTVPTKQVWLYTFDRVTGQPVWPIEERPVPPSDVPGEKAAKTQPYPTKPPAYARNEIKIPDDLIDFTPEMRAQARDVISRYRVAGVFNPPLVGDSKGLLGALNIGHSGGGTNWPGGGADPETHIVYVQANNSQVQSMSLRTPPAGFSDLAYVSGRNDQPFRVAEAAGAGTAADAPQKKLPAGAPPAAAFGGNFGPNPLQVQGLPLVKPPYGVISAVDMDKGEMLWQVPYGETPDNVRNHPALKGLKIGNTGQGGSVGLVVTKNLVILGDSQVTNPGTHPRGAMLRAYDKKTGKEVGAVWMPAPQSGSPMTYMWQGKQYIVVAVSGGNYSGEYLAYALPDND
ncbi:MAG TPA: PQQ-binding-like beta-propeller repeat protein [Bryobacteraceae bacterium]|nr:PQQ-binding-like beta-propeller repeat protein [Bryobacteraceae bacterium]